MERPMIAEDAIRKRSYLIWQREGCVEGNSREHWLRAKAELEAELQVSYPKPGELSRIVVPRPQISHRPQRVVSARVPRAERPVTAATR
jgi:hypothetical protein